MNKSLSFLLLPFILCTALLSCKTAVPGPDTVQKKYVHTAGQQIIDEYGDPLWLVGFGLGGWLVPEGYMLKLPGEKYNGPTEIKNMVGDLVGKENAGEIFDLYYKNYVAEKDIEIIASWGANSVRLPFTWKILMKEEPPYEWKKEGFDLIHRAVTWCEKYGLYIILDMHCAPGAQSVYNIADSDGTARLWEEPEKYWPLAIKIWRELAARYADHTLVIGYDLLNEPYGDKPCTKELKQLYMEITGAIREVDPFHILFIEGGAWAQDFACLVPPWDNNMVYTFHRYPPATGKAEAQTWLALREKYNVPVWLGETGENTSTVYNAATEFLKASQIGVSWWTHKKIAAATSPFSSQIRPGYRKILDYLSGTGPRLSPGQAKEGLMAQVSALAIDKCLFFAGIVESFGLTPHNHPVPPFNVPEAFIPGRIEAEDYNDFSDTTRGNNGGVYRMDDVDIELCQEGGYNVGWISAGEWLAFNVSVKENGKYLIEIRAARLPEGNGGIRLKLNNTEITDRIRVPSTGAWQSWVTVSRAGIELEKGKHILKLVMEEGSFNINWISFIKE